MFNKLNESGCGRVDYVHALPTIDSPFFQFMDAVFHLVIIEQPFPDSIYAAKLKDRPTRLLLVNNVNLTDFAFSGITYMNMMDLNGKGRREQSLCTTIDNLGMGPEYRFFSAGPGTTRVPIC